MSGKFEAIILHLIGMLKTNITDYCDLETIDGGRSVVANDGSLATLVKFNGTKSVLGRDQFIHLVVSLEASLSPFFKTRGHQLQVVFKRDFDASSTLEFNAAQQRATANKIGLDVSDIIQETVTTYSRYVYEEECYFVFWSRPSLLDSAELKMSQETINEFRKTNEWPSMAKAQNILRPISFLSNQHNTFVSKITDDLSGPQFGCSVEVLDINDGLRAIRKSVFSDYTSNDWMPSIPGSNISVGWKNNSDFNDLSEFMHSPLPEQIMVGTAMAGTNNKKSTLPDPTMIQVGSKVYAPLIFKKPPRDPQFFNALFNTLNRAETTENQAKKALPYSISFMLESDGMSSLMLKTLASTILSATSEVNRNINLSVKSLQNQQRDGTCIVKLRMAAMTWAGNDAIGVKELSLRKSKLWSALEGWGSPEIIEKTGDPMTTFQSNVVGLTTKHIGVPCPAPLDEALSLLPLTRPASPFKRGNTIYRSLDGKILRYERFSNEQPTWITLASGGPGSGKSVLMNSNNIDSCLISGLSRLPYIGIIDIGISSVGFIDTIKDALPQNQQHLAIYRRIQNTDNDCINPLDTSLGTRAPLPREREFMRNFICMLITPAERKGKPYEGMFSFVGRVIDIAFQNKSDLVEKGFINTYRHGHHNVIDDAVNKIGFPVTESTSYWELVDAFFNAGLYYEAEFAQRYAVPILDDLSAAASEDIIQGEYSNSKTEGDRNIISTFLVGIREAVSEFPIFRDHTKFDVGSSRIMSLDLQDVASEGSDAATKQTALMYMIARQLFMKKVAFSDEDLPSFSKLYRPYFDRLINEIMDENKVFFMDEYHMTKGHPILNSQLMSDGRVSRKFKMEIVLSSQILEDFGELCKIATTIFILDSGTPELRKWMKENIGLTDVEEMALINSVHGVSKDGMTFLAKFKTKKATYSQLFTSTTGPLRLWALATGAEDRKLRKLLYAAMPKLKARKALAAHFPSGSCKDHIDILKETEFKGRDFIDEDMISSVIERVAKQIIKNTLNNRA